MKLSLRAVCLFATLTAFTGLVRAQAPRPTRLDSGKVLVLDNDRLLEGDIERVGDQYRIRRGNGELFIPAIRAKRLCRDTAEAFLHMQSLINLQDPDERLRLARWCQSNGLKDRALAEAQAALQMRPEHAETLQLIQILQRLTISSSGLGTAPPAAVPAKAPSAAKSRTGLDVSQESFGQFASKVQPILLNACVSCHNSTKATTFQLQRPSELGFRIAAQKNLSAALEFIDAEKAVLSPLLIKAVVPHGGAEQPPLRGGRQSVPFQTLQSWVVETLAANPHVREIRRAENGMPPPVFGPVTSAKHSYTEESTAPPPPAKTKAAPAAPPASRDPFDPAEFNRKR